MFIASLIFIFLVGLIVAAKLTLLFQLGTLMLAGLLFLLFHGKFEGLAIGIPILWAIVYFGGLVSGNIAFLLLK